MKNVVNTENIPKKKTKKITIAVGIIIFLLFINMVENQWGNFNFKWQITASEQNKLLLKMSSACFKETFPIFFYEGREQIWQEYLGMNTGIIGYRKQTENLYGSVGNKMEQQTILWRNQERTEKHKNTVMVNTAEEIQKKTQEIGLTAENQSKTGIGDTFFEELKNGSKAEQEKTKIEKNKKVIETLKENMDTDYLIDNFYIVDSTTKIDRNVFNVKKLLNKDLSLKKKKQPQILIYHTHAVTEAFKDSRAGKKEDTVVGVGSYLADILTDIYGYQVIHDETEYDNIGGKIDRNKAYNNALDGVEQILEKYPDIEVIIDLHRDAVNNNNQRVTEINGKKTAQIMLFNGLSRNQRGDISYLYNPNLQANLAFSLQLKLAAMEKYPEFTIRNYLKGYRYNLHLRERSLLIELGNENSTVEEAKNAMEPLAEILNEILTGKNE